MRALCSLLVFCILLTEGKAQTTQTSPSRQERRRLRVQRLMHADQPSLALYNSYANNSGNTIVKHINEFTWEI
jgi:hypothetical protein